MDNPFLRFDSITPTEMLFLKNKTAHLTEAQLNDFTLVYASKRRDATLILLLTIAGFFGVAGIQRFLVGQVGMGLLYFFTGGLCAIGTIVDIINYKQLTEEYNEKMADECLRMV